MEFRVQSPSTSRAHFRPHSLDGAMLFFHPATGTHVQVKNSGTRNLQRTAPRVVMFGITNACNLSCGFCSRDVRRESQWTVDTAAEVLHGLWKAGTLEVAFGGGEPFAWKAFPELARRLRDTTSLALHATTNGTLLDDAMLKGFGGALGQVRVSLYDDVPWRPAAQALTRAKQLWGANVLVDDRTIARLPALLCELGAMGARDVSLLSYVGPEPSLHLSSDGERALGAIIAGSPVPCRVSVCFGERLGVPRLLGGALDADCGAGLDFLSITPDRRVQSCSFQEESFPIDSAADVLHVFRSRREALRRASPRAGCARLPVHPGSSLGATTSMHVWQSFSGNNSGECHLVSTFETVQDAERFLADLIPGYVPGEPFGAPWKELFEREHVACERGWTGSAPEEMITVGRTFLARTDYAPGDEFPELRALSWKRGGKVVAGGIHVHGTAPALTIIRARDKGDAAALVAQAEREGSIAAAHGLNVLVTFAELGPNMENEPTPRAPLSFRRDAMHALAGDRPFVMETVYDEITHDGLVGVMKKLATPAREEPRMALGFWGMAEEHGTPVERARALAKDLDGTVTQIDSTVLVEGITRKSRLAVLGYRRNAWVTSLESRSLECWAQLFQAPVPRQKGKKAPDPPPLEPAVIEPELRARLRLELGAKDFEITECCHESFGGRIRVRVLTSAPADVLKAMTTYASSHGLLLHQGVREPDPLERAVRRLLADLDS